jgi:hypothetical protein
MEAQDVAVEEADRGLVWTCGAAFAGEDVIHAHGIQMIKNRKAPTGFKDAGASSVHAEQGNLCLEPYTCHPYERTPASSTPHPTIATLSNSQSRHSAETQNGQRTLQDLLFPEGLLAARLSVGLDSLDDLQSQLVHHLKQNSVETRTRYAQSVLKWFFPDGLGSLVCHVWAAYNDKSVTADILRYLYLVSEPIMGTCVTEALYPLEEGMLIPADYFDRFLRNHLGGEPPPKTRQRLKTNLMKLGFLARARGKPDRLQPVIPTNTAFLILLHHLFAPNGPRTVEIRYLFAHPFWKYLGFKSEDAVRAVLRSADAAGLLGKYIVADQLEQVTTCLTLHDIFTRKVRL